MKKIIYYLPAFLFLIPLVFSERDLTLLPNDKKLHVGSYNDSSAGLKNSNSVITKAANSELVLDYTLQPSETADPYAAMKITLTDTVEADSFYDITPYTHLCIDIVTKQGTSFFVYLKTFIEGFTVFGNWRTYYFASYQAQVHIGSKQYRLPLKDFRPPDWWWKEVGPRAASLPQAPDNTKLFGIDIKSGSGAPVEQPDQFVITKIAFISEDRPKLLAMAFAGFGAYIALTFLIIFFRSRSKRTLKGRELNYRPLDISNQSDEEVKRLEDYIGTNFQESELTVEKVGRETGITPSRIPVILQQKHKKAFKQYLNDIRITESKRLLKETDRTITEIAFAVGYNNVSHFNRVFRQGAGTAPTMYRDTSKS